MAGRPADPTRRRRQTGNRPMPGEPRKLKTIPRSPSDAPPVYEPPARLPEEVREMWRIAVDELAPRGLREADLEAITMMCNAAHRYHQAADAINKVGLLVEGQRGPMVNPLTKVEKDNVATYMRIAEAYGLTIASRMRLGLVALTGHSLLDEINKGLDA